mmetsp:Transcript_22482/g.49167  ORF Transcript_22482/g.49167 Transcript_22482/m.49167 type:complete len:439 (-) Transcript_22482:75-1391(-)
MCGDAGEELSNPMHTLVLCSAHSLHAAIFVLGGLLRLLALPQLHRRQKLLHTDLNRRIPAPDALFAGRSRNDDALPGVGSRLACAPAAYHTAASTAVGHVPEALCPGMGSACPGVPIAAAWTSGTGLAKGLPGHPVEIWALGRLATSLHHPQGVQVRCSSVVFQHTVVGLQAQQPREFTTHEPAVQRPLNMISVHHCPRHKQPPNVLCSPGLLSHLGCRWCGVRRLIGLAHARLPHVFQPLSQILHILSVVLFALRTLECSDHLLHQCLHTCCTDPRDCIIRIHDIDTKRLRCLRHGQIADSRCAEAHELRGKAVAQAKGQQSPNAGASRMASHHDLVPGCTEILDGNLKLPLYESRSIPHPPVNEPTSSAKPRYHNWLRRHSEVRKDLLRAVLSVRTTNADQRHLPRTLPCDNRIRWPTRLTGSQPLCDQLPPLVMA